MTQFDRVALLALVGQVACANVIDEENAWAAGMDWHTRGALHPFTLAAVARDVILDGYQTATKRPRAEDLERLCGRYLNLSDPIAHRGDPFSSTASYLVRVAYEQFPHQLSKYKEMSRTWALFGDTAGIEGVSTMTPEAWRQTLGCALDEFIRIVFALYTAAIANHGWVDAATVTNPEIVSAIGNLSAADVWHVVSTRLSGNIRELKNDPGNIKMSKGFEKYRYNPLISRPYVHLKGRLLAPAPHLAGQRTWPNSVYYDRVKDDRFTDELGLVFEAYIGRQLETLNSSGIAKVWPKVLFNRGNGDEESVDWFVVFPEIILLVEAKATRLTAEARLGRTRLEVDVERTLAVAYRQIEKSAEHIHSRRNDFSHLPPNRPMLGLAVTLEPYWLAWGKDMLPRQPARLRAHPISCGEIESLVSASLAGRIDNALMELSTSTDRGSRAFSAAFAKKKTTANPLLDAAFDHVLGHLIS